MAVKQGIITFNVPATKNAKLYVVAVHFSGQTNDTEGNKVFYFGVVENLGIPIDGTVEITMDDINWVPATWKTVEGYEDYPQGFRASKDEEYHKIPIYVREPFQIGEKPAWNQLYVKIWGCCSWQENLDGWRRFEIINKNNEVGVKHSETYSFQPYIEPILFNLISDSGYSIPPLAKSYSVDWE